MRSAVPPARPIAFVSPLSDVTGGEQAADAPPERAANDAIASHEPAWQGPVAVPSVPELGQNDQGTQTRARQGDTSPTVQVGVDVSARLSQAFDRPRIDRYEVQEQVGTGGMSVVYAARDVELDRRVALKVMRLDLSEPTEQAQLLAEARSLAGLNHPNIVPVYDVGHDRQGRLYMAMELVRGQSMRAWLDASTRSPSEILDVLIAAGRGLASAHAVELVHCDFKPSNVLVGEDGRVRVLDFGIARRVFRPEPRTGQTQTGASLDPPAPREQVVTGTPRYMSPEQLQGEPLTPSTDQFSFCLTLYEALYGQAPFLGRSTWQRLERMLADTVPLPPPGCRVPKRIHAVLVRGLRAEPEARWPNIDALLRALQRSRSRTRTVGGLVVAGLMGSGFAGAAMVPAVDPCAATGEEAASVWTPQRRSKIRDAFRSSGIANPDLEHARIDAKLSRFAEQWAAARVQGCETASGAPERRSAQRTCLHRALEQFSVLVEEVAAGDAATLRNSPEAVSSLPTLASCDAAVADEHAAAPPEIRDRVEGLEEELATIATLVSLHRYQRADEITARVLLEADQLAFAPLLAEAQHRRADLLHAQGLQFDAANLFEQAFHTAQAARRDRLAARVAVKLHLTYGYHVARPRLAARWAGLAQAAVDRLGNDAGALRAEQVRTVGLVALRNADYALARERFEEALALYEGLTNPAPLHQAEAQSNFGIAAVELGDLEAADAAFRSALEKTEREVGRFNNRHITIINNLGNLEQLRGNHQASHDYFAQVYETEVALYGGDDVRVAMSLNNMGTALMSLRRDAEAIVLFERSIQAYESGDHHGVDLARPVGNLGVAHTRANNYKLAERSLVQAIALIESELGPMHADSSIHWFNLGSVRLEQGEYPQALEAMHRSLEIDEHALGRQHPFVAQTLSAIAMTYVRSGQPERSKPLLEEALRIFAAFDIDPLTVHYTKFELAKVMWHEGDYEPARQLIDEAEAVFESAGHVSAPQLFDLQSWKERVSY